MGGLLDFGSPSDGLYGLLAQIKRKVFISYHHGGDRAFYDLFSRTYCNEYDVIEDNSLERAIDSDDVDYVRWRLSDKCITGSSCTIVLVGRYTWGRKFVDWEIDATLDKKHGLIGILLPTGGALPPRLKDNIQSGYAPAYFWSQINATTLKQAIELANAKPTSLIDNTQPRRYRNASLWEVA